MVLVTYLNVFSRLVFQDKLGNKSSVFQNVPHISKELLSNTHTFKNYTLVFL